MKKVDDALGIRTLSFEYELIACFFDKEELSPKEIFPFSSASGTSFFALIQTLERQGILESETNPKDGRSKLYRLSDMALDSIGSQWRKNVSAEVDDMELRGNARESLSSFAHELRRDLKIKHLTCEFQILLYLFIKDGMTNLQFHDLVDVSETKFNKSLRSLKSSGLLYSSRNEADGRSKVYHLSDNAKTVIGECRSDVLAWLDEKAQQAPSMSDGYEAQIFSMS